MSKTIYGLLFISIIEEHNTHKSLQSRTTRRNWVVRQECSLSEACGGWDSESTSSGLLSDVLSELGGVSLISITSGLGSDSDNSGVDGAGHAVTLLDVNLGKLEVAVVVSVVLLDISLGGTVDHVSHLESLDGLILGGESSTVQASHHVGVSLVLLTSPVISSL